MIRSPSLGRSLLAPAAVIVLALVGAACSSGSSSPGVASLGSTTTTVPAGIGQGTISAKEYAETVDYSECMRSHGLPNFPDPTAQGSFLDRRGVVNGQRVNLNSSQYASANKRCQHLLPNGGKATPAELQRAMADALKFAACMRAHGLPNFPDPVESDGGITQRLVGPPGSPVLRRALRACRSFMPDGAL